MIMGFTFNDLDLSSNTASSGERRLKAGRYACKITGVELRTNKDGVGRSIQVEFTDVDSGGKIMDFINVYLPNSPKAETIGRDRLKSMLEHGGHPTPDKPGDIKSLVGLVVGVNVEESEYVSNGETRIGSEVASWHPYFSAEGATGLGEKPTATAPVKPNGSAPAFHDDPIPF
jgi:hypothetical protein